MLKIKNNREGCFFSFSDPYFKLGLKLSLEMPCCLEWGYNRAMQGLKIEKKNSHPYYVSKKVSGFVWSQAIYGKAKIE